MPATTADETAGWFRSGSEDLFGILTAPTTDANGLGCLFLSGGGRDGAAGTPSPGVNRVWVRLARQLADRGFHSLRIDYRGIGESSGERPVYDLADPFDEDVVAAVGWMRAQGVGDVALIGTCFGGRAALAAAAQLEGLRGVALLGSPVRDFRKGERIASQPVRWYLQKATDPATLKRLGDSRRRRAYRHILAKKARHLLRGRQDPAGRQPSTGVSPRFLSQLGGLVDAGIPVLLVFGSEDAFLEDFERARAGPLGTLLARAGGLVRVEILDGRVHGLTTRAGQDATMACTAGWLEGLAASSRV